MGEILKECRFYYDRLGNKVKKIDRVVALGRPDRDVITTWEYDCMGRLISTTEAAGSPQQKKTIRDYDLSGQLVSLQKSDGVELYYNYDPLGE